MKESINVLIIEDSKDDTELLVKYLENEGLAFTHKRVQAERSLKSALSGNSWDIVISDYVLPSFDGLEAYEVVREHDVDLPFIIVSGKIGEEQAVEAMRLGVNDYVMKANLRRLLPAIERAIADAEIRREHRRIDEERKKYERRHRIVIENASEGIAVIRQGKFVMVNPKVVEVLGVGEDDLRDRPVDQFIHPDDRRKVVDFYKRRMKGQDAPLIYTFRIEDKHGRLTWIENRVVVVNWEGEPATLNFLADITEHIETEKMLCEATRKLEAEREDLYKKNIALEEVLGRIESEKESLKRRIAENIENRVRNTIRRLHEIAPPDLRPFIEILDRDLDEIASPFLDKIKSRQARLSPRELEICYMIKNGMRSKEIAEFLNISLATVHKHRELIRRKFELVGSDNNLSSFLQSME